MSQEQYEKLKQKQKGGTEQLTADALKGVASQYDEALAIDPGKTTGAAWTDGNTIRTWTTDFWGLLTMCDVQIQDHKPGGPTILYDETAVLLEAPYLSAAMKGHGKPAIAYRSGQVAREAELLHDRLESLGYHVEEFDPARYDGGKWNSKTAHSIVGDWTGPDNDDVRDAIRLLVFYNFI